MKILWTIIVLSVIAIAAGLAVIFTGAYNVAATDGHFQVVRWALDTTFQNSVARRAEDVTDVPALDDQAMLREGAKKYVAMCAVCHGVPYEARPAMAKHMLPEPPHLSQEATHWAPNEIFWIVKNGVKMSGMPAFGPTHADQELWPIVAFVDRLPEMSEEDYRNLTVQEEEQEKQKTAGSEANGASTSERQTESAQENGAAAATVGMTDRLKFDPAQVTVQAGQTVKWVNSSGVPHTVTADPAKASDPAHVVLPEGAETFDSGMLQPGDTFTHTFTVPGRYRYFCIPHEAAGMIAEVEVTEGS